jgi:hypothetical protein
MWRRCGGNCAIQQVRGKSGQYAPAPRPFSALYRQQRLRFIIRRLKHIRLFPLIG